MIKIRNFVFGGLYWRWFGDGQAYNSPCHYAAADVLKILAGWPYRPPNTASSRLADLLDNLCALVIFASGSR